jgi:exonuclease SbcD
MGADMTEIKFVHCADIHLDAPLTAIGTQNNRSSIRRADLKQAFQKIVDTVKVEKAQLLLICGDFFEHGYVRKSTIYYVNDIFKTIPDTSIFILPGNHDPYAADSFYVNFKWNENVNILSPDNSYVILSDLGACVYGCGFENSGFDIQSCLAKPLNPELINVLLLHGTVDMNFSENAYNTVTSQELDSLGMDYIAMGHFHNRLEGLGSNKNIYNPGSPEPLGFDEPGEHGFFTGSIKKAKGLNSELEIKFIKSNKRTYMNIAVNIDGCSTDEQVISKIKSAVQSDNMESGLFSITLKGYIDKEFKMDLRYIQSYFEDKVFLIKIKDETCPDYDFEEIACEPGLKGLFVKKMMGLINNTEDSHNKEILTKSLYYGLEALERGSIDLSSELV